MTNLTSVKSVFTVAALPFGGLLCGKKRKYINGKPRTRRQE